MKKRPVLFLWYAPGLLLCCFLFLWAATARAQSQVSGIEIPKVVSPSPEAASLGKYGNIPVTLYNGIPSINVPLYNISVGELSVPISLSYHSNGIKVAEDASWVGLGFSLSAGGTITRSVAGFDDFVPGGYLNAPAIPADISLDPNYAAEMGGGIIDTEPDIFIYNVLGKSGKFILKKGIAFGTPDQVMHLTNSALKITCTRLTGSGNKYQFLIVDEKGYKYHFNVQETSTTLGSSGGQHSGLELSMTYNSTKDLDVPTAWHLTKIVSPYNKEINFEYDQLDSENKHKYFSLSPKSISETFPILHTHSGCGVTGEMTWPTYKVSISQSVVKNAFLKKITWPNGELEFITSAREDIGIGHSGWPNREGNNIVAARKLDEIRVKSGTRLIKSFKFVFDYYNKQQSDKVAYWRLRLDSLLFKGNTDTTYQRYAFEYQEGSLPAKESCNIDYWGYANGSGNDGRTARKLLAPINFMAPSYTYYEYDGANREPNLLAARTGLLNKIVYPTGGSIAMQHELNNYTVTEAQEPPTGTMYEAIGTPVSDGPEGYYWDTLKVRNYTTVQLEATLIAGPSPNVWAADTLISYDTYQKKFAELIPVGSSTPIYYQWYGDWYIRDDKSSNVFSPAYGTMQLAPGNYIMRVYKHKQFRADFSIRIPIIDNAAIPLPDPFKMVTKNTGGLRIAKITETYSEGNTIVRNYDYTQRALNNEVISTGKILAPTKYYYDGVFLESGYTSGGTPCGSSFQSRTFTSNSNIPMATSASGYHIGYSKVTERWNDGDGNGHTIHLFENQEEIVDFDAVPGTPSYTFHNLNGKERDLYQVSANGDTLQSNATVHTLYNGPSVRALKGMGGLTVSTTPRYYLHGATYYDLRCNNYYPTHVWERSKTPDGQVLEQKKEFNYNYTTHHQVTDEKVYGSGGVITLKLFRYPQDTTFSGDAELARQRLVADNRVAEVVSSKTIKNNSVQQVITEYYISPETQLVAPKTVHMNTGANYSMEPRLRYFQYDNKGNLLSVSKENDVKQSYIWDYQQSLPIAQVTNATADQIAYTSFESDGNGNLYIHTPQNITSTDAITGTKSYAINGILARFNLTPAQTYIVSLWTKGGIPDYNGFNGSTPVVPSANAWTTGQTINGWTYREKRLSGVTTINIGGGNGLVDEVRIYPEKSQMTTYTYDPLIGITSQNDANSRATYYEYDGFTRLLRIRDDKGSILKQYDYRYQVYAHNNPVWQSTGNTRCKPCPANGAYTTNMQQIEERDNNPGSPTYNQTRWTDTGNPGSCTAPTAWTNTSTAVRCKQVSGVNTGEQEQEQRDLNPCSGTYNQTRWVVTGTNTTACPVPPPCSGPDKMMINGVCVTGIKRYLASGFDQAQQKWACLYRYEFLPNCVYGPSYTEYNAAPCMPGNACIPQ